MDEIDGRGREGWMESVASCLRTLWDLCSLYMYGWMDGPGPHVDND